MATTIIVRKKALTLPGDKPGETRPGPVATHYVTRLGPAGNVAGLTDDRAKAAEFGPEDVARHKAFHADRKRAGAFEYPGLGRGGKAEAGGEPR